MSGFNRIKGFLVLTTFDFSLEEEFALKRPSISAFGAANMSSWREFWGRIEWPWLNAPLTRTSALLSRHVEGEISLHPAAIVTLVDAMGVEAARWLDPRIPEDRGHVAMTLVRLLAHSTQYSSDPIRPAVGVTLAAFTLAIHDYPGGINKPSSESRTRRALEVVHYYNSNRKQAEGHEELLMFGLLGLLNKPESYLFTSEEVAAIATTLALSHKTNTKDAPLPFLPPSFDLEAHLINTVLVYLLPPTPGCGYSIDEGARAALLNLLALQPHTWAHNERLYTIVASNLYQAQTEELQIGCLAAITSQWVHTPPICLLKTLVDQGISRTLLKILKSSNSRVSSMAMHPLWMIVNKTLEVCSTEENEVAEKPGESCSLFKSTLALRSIIADGLFSTLAELFQATDDIIVAPHHVNMWLGTLKALGSRFPFDIVKSNVLSTMVDFYSLYTLKGPDDSVFLVGNDNTIRNLRELLEACTTAVHPMD